MHPTSLKVLAVCLMQYIFHHVLTCSLLALPLPTTGFLIFFGANSTHGMFFLKPARIIVPLACPSNIADLKFFDKKYLQLPGFLAFTYH
ncbi:MAG: hypothetical protein CM1200mP10_17860 [Candidatus Neomarinimicrobiota bacterium]|nr:MAG: hypothetical protein CM1200mP10_17860 [Candidatus Neomarinimicrobiota bacterium]